MDTKQAVKIVTNFNKWRRGAKLPQPNPTDIGIAIDIVLMELKKYQRNAKTQPNEQQKTN